MFQTLIGTVKTGGILRPRWTRGLRFQTLIGTVKTEEAVPVGDAVKKFLRVLLDPDPWGVKKEGVLCLQTGSTPFTILTQKPAR